MKNSIDTEGESWCQTGPWVHGCPGSSGSHFQVVLDWSLLLFWTIVRCPEAHLFQFFLQVGKLKYSTCFMCPRCVLRKVGPLEVRGGISDPTRRCKPFFQILSHPSGWVWFCVRTFSVALNRGRALLLPKETPSQTRSFKRSAIVPGGGCRQKPNAKGTNSNLLGRLGGTPCCWLAQCKPRRLACNGFAVALCPPAQCLSSRWTPASGRAS